MQNKVKNEFGQHFLLIDLQDLFGKFWVGVSQPVKKKKIQNSNFIYFSIGAKILGQRGSYIN